jgi:non-ribosomal peptide synthetase component F
VTDPSNISGRLARLSLEERALLFERLRRKKEHEGATDAPPAIPRRSGGGPPPLSFAQQRLWFLHRLAPLDPSYNVPIATLVRGPVDPAALRAALAAVCARHESQRTTFATDAERGERGERGDGSPVQVIAPALAVPLPVVDLARLGLRCEPMEPELERLCRAVFHLPFDLAAGPLLRAVLVRLAPERHVIVLVQHHIVSDGWSIGVLMRDVMALYHSSLACLRGEDPAAALPPLPVQYADFAVWQRGWLSGERLENQLAVWRQRLGDLPPPLVLPTDRPRPPLKTSHGAFQELRLSGERVARLNAVAREEGATPYMVLLAAFQVFLGRYSGQADFAVGSAVANRNRPELKELIGFFVNTLALRADLSGDPTVRELLARVRDTALEAFAHQDLPFEKLVEELRPERDPSRTPIFQVSLSLLNTPAPQVDFGGLSIEILHPDPRLVKFDLDVALETRERGGLEGAMGYSTDLFDAATAARMAEHFLALLAAPLADRGARISELPLLQEAERRQILEEWNRTAADWPRERAPIELVEERAAASPAAPAVVWTGGVLSYGELMARAERWACRLRALGAGPEVPVAVLLPRSPQLVLALVAVARAGGVYLPVDPAYPDERIAAVLEESGAPVVLTLAALAGRIGGGRTVLCLDRELEPEAAVDGALRPDTAGAAALAYIVYTSGSTGRPKGVGVPRGALVNLLTWHLRRMDAGPGDRMVVTSGPGFDASLWEMWASLTSGATVCIPEEEVRLAPPRLADWLEREGITIAFFPTPLAESVLAEPALARTRLRRLMTGGDRLHRIARRDLPFPVVNLYGPSEATVIATCAPAAQLERDRDPSIGRPTTPGSTCSMTGAGRCRWACRGSCGSAARSWRAGMWAAWAVRTSRRRPTGRTHSPPYLERGCTPPATSPAGAPAASWRCSAAATGR